MAAPMVLIVLELEERPRIVTLARIEEESRLMHWLRTDPRVGDLIADALDIVTQPAAAPEQGGDE